MKLKLVDIVLFAGKVNSDALKIYNHPMQDGHDPEHQETVKRYGRRTNVRSQMDGIGSFANNCEFKLN